MANHSLDTLSETATLTEYRLTKLEEAITSLVDLKEIVARWDTKFSGEGLFNCPLHNERMIGLNKRMDAAEADIGQLKKFVYKATGALIIISIVVQLLMPVLIDHFGEHATPNQVELLGK